MLCMRVLQRWHSGDGCDLSSTLCKYDWIPISVSCCHCHAFDGFIVILCV